MVEEDTVEVVLLVVTPAGPVGDGAGVRGLWYSVMPPSPVVPC